MQKEASFAYVGDTIKESVPPLSPVADLLPSPPAERYAFISLALKAIVLFISELGQSDEPTVEVHQVLNAVYEEEADSPSPVAATPLTEEGTKVGRNDPCPCGSGKKYKKCCL
ncbi:MAG: SEC-C metal-binding domain-containing protein [Thermodesulfobacteriota bacterium]